MCKIKFTTFGFLGLGLIGGSIARSIRDNLPESKIIAYNRHREASEAALADGVADIIADEPGEAFSGCDIIFLCMPVGVNNDHVSIIKPFLKDGAILTDVGSVKTPIHNAVKEAGLEAHFIGGHPMAGSERVGYAASKTSILQNAYYILTPTDTVPEDSIDSFVELVKLMDAIPLVLTCDKHDEIVAGVSHLPHVIAAALVGLVRDSDGSDGLMKTIAAGGFKDITRIASSSAEMWRQICLTNDGNIDKLLTDFIASLESFKTTLESRDPDKLYDFFDGARSYRDSFVDAGHGPIKVRYEFTVDIADEPGALAAIATILALNGISIKNIGILHNREYLGGDLRIEFEDGESLGRAESILSAKGYTIHNK
ncbi:MAG: prephenate dehydrogenase [Lachnospiraceae bacterium]|nr:prephenate dehydrogenase [Lachnospiraceae bacterium]